MQSVIQVSEGFPGSHSASLMNSHSLPVEHNVSFTLTHTFSRRITSAPVWECSVMGVKTTCCSMQTDILLISSMMLDTYTFFGILRKEVWMNGKVKRPESIDGICPWQTSLRDCGHIFLGQPAEDNDMKVSSWSGRRISLGTYISDIETHMYVYCLYILFIRNTLA